MLTCQEIIKLQEQHTVGQEKLYAEFKEKINVSIDMIPNHVKVFRNADYYPVLTSAFSEFCEFFCERYVKETGTDLKIVSTCNGDVVQIRWR